jgi:hypothetical protein
MKNKILKVGTIFAICVAVLFVGSVAFAQTPTADAGADLYLNSGQTGTLQGSGLDPNNYNLTYYWSCSGGNLSSNNIAQPTYTAPFVYQYNNQVIYTCTLTVTNSFGQSASDTTTVYVNYNNNIGGISAQTNSATNIFNNQATLNGYVTNTVYQSTTNSWFQWGTSTNYGNETTHQSLNTAGSFSQNIVNLSPNTTYHFRAVAQATYGNVVYGQDMTFYTSGSNNTGSLTVTKKVINLTNNNLVWQASVNAKPSDILSFVVTLQARNQSVNNIFVRDLLPANLIYNDNLTINASLNNTLNPTAGINVGTLPAGEVYVIAYQARVAPDTSFPYGLTTLSNTATVTSSQGTQTSSAQVLVNNTTVSGATYVPAGITNNPITDSFFWPLFLIILGSWLYLSGRIYKFADWLKIKTK